MKRSNNNTLIIALIVLTVLFLGYYGVTKYLLPVFTSAIINTSINSTIGNLDFENAESFQIKQDLSKNNGMYLQIATNKGKILIDGNSSDDIFSGIVKYLGEKPTYIYQTNQDNSAGFKIESTDQAGEDIELHLSQQTNGVINIAQAAGFINIDLTNLDMPAVNISQAAGDANIIFSNKASTTANIAIVAGKINLSVYKGTAVKITLTNGYNNLNLGESYVKVGNSYISKGYADSKIKVDLNITQTSGGFNIIEI